MNCTVLHRMNNQTKRIRIPKLPMPNIHALFFIMLHFSFVNIKLNSMVILCVLFWGVVVVVLMGGCTIASVCVNLLFWDKERSPSPCFTIYKKPLEQEQQYITYFPTIHHIRSHNFVLILVSLVKKHVGILVWMKKCDFLILNKKGLTTELKYIDNDY